MTCIPSLCSRSHIYKSIYIVHTSFTDLGHIRVKVRVMVFNATFNNNSVISWLLVLLVEEIGVLGKNHRPAVSR